MSDLEDRLRAELNRNAERAPGATLLAERIIAAARTQPRPASRRGWPTWTMPLLAAAAVAAIVGGVFVGVSEIRDSAAPPVPGLGSQVPTVTHPTPTHHPSPTTGKPSPTAPSSNPPNAVGLHNFAASDLTFSGAEDGWALGMADCLDGSGGRCPAMVRTIDGGQSWHSLPQPPNDATGIRFATPEIGYAFGDCDHPVFEMTIDGGQSWTQEPGGATAVEIFEGNVIRVESMKSGVCPPGVVWKVSIAPIGSPNWTPVDLPGAGPGDGVTLVRSDHDAYLVTYGNPAGGGDARTVLWSSTDDGASWTRHSESCPQTGGEVDTASIAASPGGTVTALCEPRDTQPQDGRTMFVAVSTDAGAHFAPKAGTMPPSQAGLIAGDPSTVLVAAGAGAYRSTDGGASWQPIADVTGDATFVGFESQTLGRIVTNGGRTVWTTTDAGASWTPFTFPN